MFNVHVTTEIKVLWPRLDFVFCVIVFRPPCLRSGVHFVLCFQLCKLYVADDHRLVTGGASFKLGPDTTGLALSVSRLHMLCVIVVSLKLEELDYHLLTCLKCSAGSCEVVLATFSNVYVWEFFFLSVWWKVRFFFYCFGRAHHGVLYPKYLAWTTNFTMELVLNCE